MGGSRGAGAQTDQVGGGVGGAGGAERARHWRGVKAATRIRHYVIDVRGGTLDATSLSTPGPT